MWYLRALIGVVILAIVGALASFFVSPQAGMPSHTKSGEAVEKNDRRAALRGIPRTYLEPSGAAPEAGQGTSYESYLDSFRKELSLSPRYTQAQADPEREAARLYGNEVGALLKKLPEASVQLSLLSRDLSLGESTGGKELSKVYGEVSADLSLISPPAVFSSIHQDFRDASQGLAERLLSFGADTIPAYNEAAQEYAHALSALALLFDVLGVTFSRSESGYIFTEITKDR